MYLHVHVDVEFIQLFWAFTSFHSFSPKLILFYYSIQIVFFSIRYLSKRCTCTCLYCVIFRYSSAIHELILRLMKVNVAERPFIDNVLEIVEENYRKFQNQVWPIRLQYKVVLPWLVISICLFSEMQSEKIVSTFTVTQHSIGMHVFCEMQEVKGTSNVIIVL